MIKNILKKLLISTEPVTAIVGACLIFWICGVADHPSMAADDDRTGFSVDAPFKDLGFDKNVPSKLLPINRHVSIQCIKNVRFCFGIGPSQVLYPYSRAVNIHQLTFPQNAIAAFVEMLFPNPHMLFANQSSDSIAKIPFKDLGALAKQLTKGQLTKDDASAVVETFVRAIQAEKSKEPSEAKDASGSASSSVDEAGLLEFQRLSFFQEIRRQVQALYEGMFNEEEEDDGAADIRSIEPEKRITYIIRNYFGYPGIETDAANLLINGFFDDRTTEDTPADLRLKNETFIHTLKNAIAELQDETSPYDTGILADAINAFAWQKFKTHADISDFYKGVTNDEHLTLNFETFPFKEIIKAARSLESAEKWSIVNNLSPHLRAAVIKHTLTGAEPPFSGVKYRSVSYEYKRNKRKRKINFADCVESQIRAFFNGIFYEVTEDLGSRFNSDLLLCDAPVKGYYRDFSVPAEMMTQEAHDRFAQLIANQEKAGVAYLSPKLTPIAEVRPGILNLLRALSYLSGIDPEPASIHSPPTRDYIESCLLTLSQKLSRPGFKLTFNIDSEQAYLTFDKILNDFVGAIEVKVNDVTTCLLETNARHGELKPLVKRKTTWLDELPSAGAEFEAMGADLKHYVYQQMPSDALAALPPELQRTIILGSNLDDVDTQVDRAIHCFSQSNPLRRLALSIAHKLLGVHDNHTAQNFLTKLCLLIQKDHSHLTKDEFVSLATHQGFLVNSVCLQYQGGVLPISNVMMAYGYKKNWLNELPTLSKMKTLNFSGWNNQHMPDTDELDSVMGISKFNGDDFSKVLGMFQNAESLYNYQLPKNHEELEKYVEGVTNLSKLKSLGFQCCFEMNLLLEYIPRLPKTLKSLSIHAVNNIHDVNNHDEQELINTIQIAKTCFTNLNNLRFLGLTVKDELALRNILSALKDANLPTGHISIDYTLYSPGEQWQDHITRISEIYKEVLGHGPPPMAWL